MSTPQARAEKFALFVTEVLNEARKAGMTNADIEAATGIGKSTFYRWRDGYYKNLPRADQVWDFCVGLGIPPDAAGRLLGLTDRVDAPTQESMLEAPLVRIQQALSNPAVSTAHKNAIRDLMRAAADIAALAERLESV